MSFRRCQSFDIFVHQKSDDKVEVKFSALLLTYILQCFIFTSGSLSCIYLRVIKLSQNFVTFDLFLMEAICLRHMVSVQLFTDIHLSVFLCRERRSTVDYLRFNIVGTLLSD